MKQILIAIDQLANTIIGGWADETLSSRAWREERRVLVAFIDGLFFWEENHCEASYISERERMQLPPEFRA
ncbi:pseudouridine synthase [Immundisolibacter sp.]